MILKWNNGQKRALNIRKKALNILERGASAPYAPPPRPRNTTVKLNANYDALHNTVS